MIRVGQDRRKSLSRHNPQFNHDDGMSGISSSARPGHVMVAMEQHGGCIATHVSSNDNKARHNLCSYRFNNYLPLLLVELVPSAVH